MKKLVQFLSLAFLVPSTLYAQSVFINEIHYDNDGGDQDEAFEIAGPASTDLSGWSVVFYNGNGGATYRTTDLSGIIPSGCGAFGAVAFFLPSNGIQNGAPDGLALVDAATQLIQFLSYEGTLTAVDGPATGMLSTDIGVAEAGSTPIGSSLQLGGTGTVYTDFTWNAPAPNSFGACNAGPTFEGGAAPNVGYLRNDACPDHTSGVTFNEISPQSVTDFNADGEESSLNDKDEFVEIVNSGTDPIDVNNWVLGDNFDSFVLSGLNPIQPTHAVVVFTRGADVSNFDPGPGNQVIAATDLSLNNDGDSVGLKNNSGVFIAVKWSGGSLNSAFRDGAALAGDSLEISGWAEGISQTRNPDYSGDWIAHGVVAGPHDWSVDGSVVLTDPRGSPGRTLDGIVLDVDDKTEIPSGFTLSQNFPNPFNPETTISYQLSSLSDVRLVVYDMLGRVVHELFAGRQGAGEHTIRFRAKGLSSGVYMYRLEAGGTVRTKQMILLR